MTKRIFPQLGREEQLVLQALTRIARKRGQVSKLLLFNSAEIYAEVGDEIGKLEILRIFDDLIEKLSTPVKLHSDRRSFKSITLLQGAFRSVDKHDGAFSGWLLWCDALVDSIHQCD